MDHFDRHNSSDIDYSFGSDVPAMQYDEPRSLTAQKQANADPEVALAKQYRHWAQRDLEKYLARS